MAFPHRGLPDSESVTGGGHQATPRPRPRPSLCGRRAGSNSTTATWSFMQRAKNDHSSRRPCQLVQQQQKQAGKTSEEKSRRLGTRERDCSRGQCASSMGSFLNVPPTWTCRDTLRRRKQRGQRGINTGANTDQNKGLGKPGHGRDRGLESMVEDDGGRFVGPGEGPSSSPDESTAPDHERNQLHHQQSQSDPNPPRHSNKRTSCIRNPCSTHAEPPTTTTKRSKRRRRRQILPPTSTSQPQQTPYKISTLPSLLTAAITSIPDPSLGLIQPDRASPSATSTQTADSATISTGIIVTIVLATIAGVVAISLAVLLINILLKRRKRRRRAARSPSLVGSDKKGHSMNTSTPMLDSTLTSAVPSFSMTPMSSDDGLVGGEGGIGLAKLRPPPRLVERKYHQTTRSEGSIQVKPSPSPTNMHTRWGKPSSLGSIPSARDLPPVYYANSGQTETNALPDQRSDRARTPNYSLFPTTATAAYKAHTTAAPSTSTISSSKSNRMTPPQTPRDIVPGPVNRLVFPGPPPNRVLPSPPIKYWHANPLLSPPPEMPRADVHIRPEEIGVAIGSPTMEERREKRPRLDESDMERLGGTYSPFKR